MSLANNDTQEASTNVPVQENELSADLQHWFMAAQQGDEDYIKANVSRFATKRNEETRTALMIAAKYDMQEIISILVNEESRMQTDTGLTALAIEITSGHQINPELFERESNIRVRERVDPGFLAAMSDNLDALQFVIQRMGDSTSGESLYLIDICIEYNSVCCLEYLMSVFKNIPSSYIDKLIDLVKRDPTKDHRIVTIINRYKQSIVAINRSATTPPRVKKRSGSTPFVGSSLKRSVSVKVEPTSQSDSSPDAALNQHQSLRAIQNQEQEQRHRYGHGQVYSEIPLHTDTFPLTMADIAPVYDQNIITHTDHKVIAPEPKIEPIADMILSAMPSLPLDSSVYAGFDLGVDEKQLGLDTTVANDLLQPVSDYPGKDVISEADYAVQPKEDLIDDGTGCRDNHKCCIEVACLMMKCDDLEQCNNNLYMQNSALHTELGELRQKIIKLEAQIEQQNTHNELLKKSLEEARSTNSLAGHPHTDMIHLETSIFDLHGITEPEVDNGHLIEKLQMYIMKSRRLEHEIFDLKKKLEESTAKIHALERENIMKGRLNQLLTEDNRRSREQSRCASVISRSESVLSPGNTFMDSMAAGLEDSIMDMITSKLTDRTKLESNILRRKVAELRTDMSQMLDDMVLISSYSMDLLPLSRDGGVYTANLRERARRLERQSTTDSVKILFKRYADLTIDCMTYLKSIRDELNSEDDDLSEPENRSKSRNRSKSKGKAGRAPSRSLFGAILHKIGLGGEG